MSTHDGWAVLPHDRGEAPAMARALLALASDPREVVWVPGRSEFLTPEPVAEAYRQSLTPARKRAPRSKKENSDG